MLSHTSQKSTGLWESLLEDILHLWIFDLKKLAPECICLYSSLCAAEQARAGKFISLQDRDRYVTTHGAMRTILARYMGCDSGHLQYEVNAYGKPYLKSSGAQKSLFFNLSHSGDIAILATARTGEVGVDVERIGPIDAAEDLARRFFSASEGERLTDSPPEKQDEDFFTLWTAKEAYIKAIGEGFNRPLDSFDATVLPGGGLQITDRWIPKDTTDDWRGLCFAPLPGYRAAVFVRIESPAPSPWKLSPKASEDFDGMPPGIHVISVL